MSKDIIIHTEQTKLESKTEVDSLIDDLFTMVEIVERRRSNMQVVYLLSNAHSTRASEAMVKLDGKIPIGAYSRHFMTDQENAVRIPTLEALIRDEDKILFSALPEQMIEEMQKRGARALGNGQYVYRIPGNPPLQWEATFVQDERITLSTPTIVPGVQYVFGADRNEPGYIDLHETLQIRGTHVRKH